jgi:hypothetical protein
MELQGYSVRMQAHMTQVGDNWQPFVNLTMNFRAPLNLGEFF